jgi:dTDP-4-amino-4,6-dideoxygalactose transaminase
VRVPLVDVAADLVALRPAIDAAIARVLDTAVFIGGAEVAGLEAELAAALGARAAVGTSSGSDALLAVLMALGVTRGDEVVTTPLTFIATAEAPARLGARVVFADVDPDTLCLDPAAAAAACTTLTHAVIPVHLFGRAAALPAVPCAVVEDAAQRIAPAPVLGRAATLSFFPTKNVGALGDAGAVVTDDVALADHIRLLREHGGRPKYHYAMLGGNFRLDALQAAVLRAKLPQLAAWTAARRDRAERYRELLAAARVPAELRVPADDASHVYHRFVVRAPRREALRAHLAAAEIATEVYYPVPLHLQPCFAELGYRAGSMPNAERACEELLALPLYATIGEAEQAYVVEEIERFYML